MNTDDVKRHLQTLNHGDAGPTELTVLTPPDGSGDRTVIATGFFSDTGKLLAAAAEHCGRHDLYVGVNPKPPEWTTNKLDGTRRAGDDDIQHLTALVLDVDPAGRGRGKLGTDEQHARALEVARGLAEELGGALIDSGGGAQVLLPLSAPVPVAELGDVHTFKMRQAAWRNALVARHDTAGVHVDATQALSHLCRLAGTVNCKGAGRPTRWLRDASDVADAILDEIHATEVPRLGPGGGEVEVELPDDLPAVAAEDLRVSGRIRDLVRDGDADGRYDSRSEAVFAVITAMLRGGHSDAEVAAVLLDPENSISERPREQRDPRAHVAAEIGRARARMPELNLPTIVTTDKHLRDVSADALVALVAANDPPSVFVRGGRLTRVRRDEDGRPVIEELTAHALRGHLARAANFVRLRSGGKDAPPVRVPTDPPMSAARDVLHLGEWPLPPLAGIAEAPVLRADGTVLLEPGYDADSALLYVPAPGLEVPPVPDEPTADQVAAARDLLLGELLGDFPFVDEASRANALALLLTPIVRPMIDEPVPMALLDAPQHGSGKTLIAEVASVVATGRDAALMSAPRRDDEWRKHLTASLMEGATVIVVDNVAEPIDSPSLGAAITARRWTDRILGETRMIEVPVRCTWAATGNNITVRGDLPRRCYWVRIDAQMAKPWKRPTEDFAHPLPAWAHEARGRLLAALLTLCRAWVAGGRPAHRPAAVLGGFEEWQRVVGGVLDAAGVDGFLGNLDEFHERSDLDAEEWVAFLSGWHEALGDLPTTVAELAERGDIAQHAPADGRDPDGTVNNRRLGHALRAREGMRWDGRGLRVEKAGSHRRGTLWRVRTDGAPDADDGEEDPFA